MSKELSQTETIFMSKKDLHRLKEEYHSRITKVRQEIAEKLCEANEFGDHRENAAWMVALDLRDFNEMRIRDLEIIIKNAQILPEHQDNPVRVGSKITLKNLITKDIKIFTLVTHGEVDINQFKFNIESPFIKNLIKAKKGDKVLLGKDEYNIIDIKNDNS